MLCYYIVNFIKKKKKKKKKKNKKKKKKKKKKKHTTTVTIKSVIFHPSFQYSVNESIHFTIISVINITIETKSMILAILNKVT